MRLPDRWRKYKNYGIIKGTRFMALKVPLREDYNRSLPPAKCFIPAMVVEKLKLIIDLTYTYKYYDGVKEFELKGVKYVKLKCKGAEVPSEEIYQKFVSIVEEFIANNPGDYLIGVHCTHGVNRTGYLIVRYMIEVLGYSSNKALRCFLESRGHAIERTNYIKRLHEISEKLSKESK